MAEATERAAAPESSGLAGKLLKVAWMSIALGITLELVLVVIAALSGGLNVKPVIGDLVQKVSWSFIVCMGLAIGTAVSKARSQVMGLLGAISAPAGFTIARTLHKAVDKTLGLGIAAGGASPFVLAGLKGIEYALLGSLLGALDRRPGGRTLTAHLVIGAVIGVVFAAGIAGVMAQAAPGPVGLAFVLPKAVNELLFPLGCSLVIYAAEAVRGKLTP